MSLKIGQYSLDKTIGSGSFGKVKKGTHMLTGCPVAVKIINKQKLLSKDGMDKKIRREIYNLQRFRHPHIIRLYEVIETNTDIFLVMEYVDGGELFDYIIARGKLPEPDSRQFFQQMISAVAYCHSHKVAHRDLKPENLLISTKNNSLKIADFGLSNIIKDGELLQTSCGSPNYAAPEIIDGKYYSGEEVDVWSCGVILYALLTARLPFDAEFIPALFTKIKKGKYKMPSFLSAECQDLISKMLIVNPIERITIPEIKNHPWFQVDLPPYLDNYFTGQNDNSHVFSERIVREMQMKYDLPHDAILNELRKGDEEHRTNHLFVTYSLLYDQYEDYDGQLPTLNQQNSTASLNSISASLIEMATSPPINLRDEIPFLDGGGISPYLGKSYDNNSPTRVVNFSNAPVTAETIANQWSKERKLWYLGLISKNHANTIMDEVYRLLKTRGYEWRVITPYQIECRKKQVDKSKDQHETKFGLQLFVVNSKTGVAVMHLLDIKKIQGQSLAFFDVCAEIMENIKL